MTARPLRSPARDPGLRVVPGRRTHRPALTPWVIVSVMTVGVFLALVGARTALDRTAFELAEINTAIAEETAINQKLRIEIAELENPARIAPLAEEMGMVVPGERHQLLVQGVVGDDEIAHPPHAAAATLDVPGPSS